MCSARDKGFFSSQKLAPVFLYSPRVESFLTWEGRLPGWEGATFGYMRVDASGVR